MATVNIPSTCDDPQYRYKMPRLVSRKEGRGRGKKTCIVNMGDVARALKRPPQYTTKWFGLELGAVSTYTNKESEGERAIINGHHDAPIFQTMLDKFIDKYVLCEDCRLPEIDLIVKKGNIMGKCKACGWLGELDSDHRLASFIKQHPPDPSSNGFSIVTGTDQAAATGKKERRQKKKSEEDEEGVPEAKEEGKKQKKTEDGDRGESAEREAAEKPKKKKKDKLEREGKADKETRSKDHRKSKKPGNAKNRQDSDDEGDDDANGVDDSPKAKERGDDDSLDWDDKETKRVIASLRNTVNDQGSALRPSSFLEEVRMQPVANVIDMKVRLYIVLEALCGSTMDEKSLGEHKALVGTVIQKAPASRMSPEDVLWAFTTYVAANPSQARRFPKVLEVVYREEWAEEESILAYYAGVGEGQPGFAEASQAARPFLAWLAMPDSDTEDQEDSESDDC